MRQAALWLLLPVLTSCASDGVFRPQSQYPPDPYVKGYAAPDDCIGGENLAAIDLTLPDYPARAFRTGRQGWVILRLDVAEDGSVGSVTTERSLPEGVFGRAAERAAMRWRFEPPGTDALRDCRVLVRFRLGEVSLGG